MENTRDEPESSAAPALDQPPDRTAQPDAASEDVEEGRAAYRLGGFHSVYIGDVFNDRSKVLNKIGYGRYSTVWLVKDLQVR